MTIRQRFATLIFACSILGGGFVTMGAGSAGAAQYPAIAVAATLDSVSTSAASALATLGTDSFTVRLENAANAVAATAGIDAGTLRTAWLAADKSHQIALLSALTQVGVPYHRNSSKPGVGFDCSGLTSFAWSQAGAAIAHQSGSQIKAAAPRNLLTAQAGDLVYYPGHVMLWLGVDTLIVHAVGHGRYVEIDTISARRVSRAKFGNPIG
jgi:cell wall-associated NlpC family hydrolase